MTDVPAPRAPTSVLPAYALPLAGPGGAAVRSGVRRSRAVTISEVADAARVSTATVSRVMNGSPVVSAALTDRVLGVVARLGYRPSVMAQGLARGRTGTVGVLVPDLANPYFHGVMTGFAHEAGSQGYRMLVATSNEAAGDEVGLADELLRQVDGLLLCSSRMSRADLQHVLDQGRPIVAANRQMPGLALSAVCVDSYAGTMEMVSHLLRLGHRRVVYLAGPELSWSNAERRRALTQSASFGLDVVHVPSGASMDDGYRAVDTALEHRPTAILAFNDIVAFGALARLRERGIGVPADLSIAGFDDIAFAAYSAPALTTVRNPTEQLGRASWKALSLLLAGERGLEPETLRPTLIERESTAAPRSGGPGPRATS